MTRWIVGIFVSLYVLTSGISTIHSIDFFKLANPEWLAITMAIAFELGAAACLAAIVILDKTTRWMVWTLFALVTSVQIIGNMFFAYTHLGDYRQWSELFGIIDQEPMLQKRVISIIAGGILPLVALGFIKSLVDMIRPAEKEEEDPIGIIQDLQDAESDVPARETQDQLHASGRHRKKPWWDA